MKVACPTCGADVEFRYDDSFVRVCDSCRAAVLRTDRGVETLGKVADLVPIESPLTLFAGGTYRGETFILVGMAQIQHAAGGTWQEWYAKFSGDKWGWLAEAQGRFYLTFEEAVPATVLPRFETLAPGRQLVLPVRGHMTQFTVGELGDATYASATGEIPYRLEPGASLRFADLSGQGGNFATIDFTGHAPSVYIGTQVTLADLGLSGGEVMPARESRARGDRLACPNCNGALELRVPDQTLRIGCPFCAHLIDVSDASGKLAIIGRLGTKVTPSIPLGCVGEFVDGKLTVVGYMMRSAYVDSSWWPFYEYLLYAPGVGFRWLVSSDGHWSYVQPIAPGAVTLPTYKNVTFEKFSAAYLRVDAVYGEFYWKVVEGELVESVDYIAPPAMISRESTRQEEHYSLSTYLTTDEVRAAFAADPRSKDITIYGTGGVGANQPYPFLGWKTAAAVSFAILLCAGVAKCNASHGTFVISHRTDIASGASPTVEFSEKFTLASGKNIAFDLDASGLSNDWVYAAVDLVNEQTGAVYTFDQSLEYYSGYEGGESWSEGSRDGRKVLRPVPAGEYVFRVEAQQGGTSPQALDVQVRQGVFRPFYFGIALLVLALPFIALALHQRGFERRRHENANPYAVNPLGGS